MNNINLNLYRSFYYVAKYNGFNSASRYTSISQSSLSSNVKLLEDFLNIKLLNRNKLGISLTSEGKNLFSKLEEVISILNQDVENKIINIGAIRVIADNYLDEVLIRFEKKYKDVKININFMNATDLYQSLRKDEVDIVICRYPLYYKFDKHMLIEKICDIENVFVCSKSFYDDNNFSDEDYIYPMILPVSSEKRRIVEQYLIDNNIKYDVVLEIPNSVLLKKMILRGFGVGYVNKKFVEKEINNGELLIVNNLKDVPLDNITIIHNSSKKNKLVNDFIAILKDAIRKSDN